MTRTELAAVWPPTTSAPRLAERATARELPAAATVEGKRSARPPPRTMAMCTMTAENIARALEGRKVAIGWMARCPAHEDRKPSLSIGSGRDGKVLVDLARLPLDRHTAARGARANNPARLREFGSVEA